MGYLFQLYVIERTKMNTKELERFLPFLSELEDERKRQFETYFETAPLWLLESFSIEEMKKGISFVLEGEPVDTIYLIGKGIIKATDYRIYGIPFDFMLFRDVYAYGGMELLMDQDTYLTTLQTVTDCTVLKIPKTQYQRWLNTDIRAMKQEAKLMGEYLFEQASNSRAFLFLQGANRLAFLFIRHYEKYAENGILQMNGERQELADFTGLCLKTITRSIQKFRSQGLLTKVGSNIEINYDQYVKLKEIVASILVDE